MEPPKELICPISGSLMVDPVTVASGHILDQISVKVCKSLNLIPILSDGSICNISCYIPNKLIKTEILKWCTINNSQTPKPMEVDKLENLVRNLMESRQPPKRYLCPILGSLLVDPVLVSSGVTFESNIVQACNNLNIFLVLPDGTKQDFSDVMPNKPIKTLIGDWCKRVGADPPSAVNVKILEKFIVKLKESEAKIELLDNYPSKRYWYLS